MYAGLTPNTEILDYLVQDAAPESIDAFFADKIEYFGSEDSYFEALGASYEDIEQKLENTLQIHYFEKMRPGKLRHAVGFMERRTRSRCTVIESAAKKAAQASLKARSGEFTSPFHLFHIAAVIFIIASYASYVRKSTSSMYMYLGLAALIIVLRVALYFVERNEYYRRKTEQTAAVSDSVSVTLHAAALFRVQFPGFDWPV